MTPAEPTAKPGGAGTPLTDAEWVIAQLRAYQAAWVEDARRQHDSHYADGFKESAQRSCRDISCLISAIEERPRTLELQNAQLRAALEGLLAQSERNDRGTGALDDLLLVQNKARAALAKGGA